VARDNIDVIEGPIASVVLNRPEKRNALSLDMMGEVIDALRRLAVDSATRVIVVRGNGPAFSAGHDLQEMAGHDRGACARVFERCIEMMVAIHAVPQPVIAQVHGLATAAGCQLVATCDLAIAADTASFATPGVKIGLFCTTPMVALTRAVGRKRAMEMLLTGMTIDAATAADWGLINRTVPAAQLDEAVRGVATRIAEASSYTVGLGKRAFYAQIDRAEADAYSYAGGVMTDNAVAEDAQEGMSAFLQKRKPEWKGR
jgi:enoyl-CoA hydratase/carnithine racemase